MKKRKNIGKPHNLLRKRKNKSLSNKNKKVVNTIYTHKDLSLEEEDTQPIKPWEMDGKKIDKKRKKIEIVEQIEKSLHEDKDGVYQFTTFSEMIHRMIGVIDDPPKILLERLYLEEKKFIETIMDEFSPWSEIDDTEKALQFYKEILYQPDFEKVTKAIDHTKNPLERVHAILTHEKSCDGNYRFLAKTTLHDDNEMEDFEIGEPVTMAYVSEFLRPPVGDAERPCIAGPDLCICKLLPSMKMFPCIESEEGFLGREFVSQKELNYYYEKREWPTLQRFCFLCETFKQSYRFYQAMSKGTLVGGIQIQSFQILVEEGIGFEKIHLLPLVEEKTGNSTGIHTPTLAFNVNDYIKGKKWITVQGDAKEVDCYYFRGHTPRF